MSKRVCRTCGDCYADRKPKKPKFLKQHLKDQDVCPVCGKDDGVGFQSPDMEDNQVCIWGGCDNCGAEFIDVFVMSNSIVTEPEGMRDDL